MKNMRNFERILRVIIGLALLLGFAMNPGTGWNLLYLLGILPVITGALGICPLYRICGRCNTKEE